MARGLVERLDAIVRDLRLGASASANAEFCLFVDELQGAMERAEWDLERLLPILQQGLDAHGRADYLGLADTLQYELRAELESAAR